MTPPCRQRTGPGPTKWRCLSRQQHSLKADPPEAEHPPALRAPATTPPSPRSPASPRGEASPAPEVAESSKTPQIAGITALEVWKAVQDWGESQESSNPLALAKSSSRSSGVAMRLPQW